jgi:4-amino-4-deoxy-L-arabinose transferase-like glycosyltransferase
LFPKPNEKLPFIWLFVMITAIRAAGMFLLPLSHDEAYYAMWSRHLDLGYFDHPPMVAWLIAAFGWLREYSEPLAIRFGSFLLLTLSYPVSLSLLRNLGLTGKRLFFAMMLTHLNFYILPLGFLALPDAPMVFFWFVALHEASLAFSKDPRRWVSAGIVTGLGLWAKYIFVLIGPIYLIALIARRQKLLTPWPYFGGIVCLLVFLPHLFWNHQNDWVSVKFQFGHGILGEHGEQPGENRILPEPRAATILNQEFLLASVFLEPAGPEKPKPHWLITAISRQVNFAFGQLALFGALLIPIVFGWRRREDQGSEERNDTRPLLMSAVWVPVIFFFFVNLVESVEANWAAIYLVAAAPLIAFVLDPKPKALLWGARLNILMVSILLAYAFQVAEGHLPAKAKNRITKESHGYKQLAEFLSSLPSPVLTDTYQNASILPYYEPNLDIPQWPGITRDSQLTYQHRFAVYDTSKLLSAGGFWLLLSQDVPPVFDQFQIGELYQLRDCKDHKLQKLDATDYHPLEGCPTIHKWLLARYEIKR